MDDQINGEVCGDSMSLFDKLKMLAEWSPLIGKLQAIAAASNPHDQALAVMAALEWAAGKTNTKLDDELLVHLEAVLRSDAGKAMFLYIVAKAIGGKV